MTSLRGKTIVMSGGSRGIGLAIALRAARDGASIALLAKTAEPHPRLEGTIYTAAEEIEAMGGRALAIVGDVRDDDDDAVADAVEQAAERVGGIDIVVNNASAIDVSPSTMTGNFFIDDEVLAGAGLTDLGAYAYVADADLQADLFLDG